MNEMPPIPESLKPLENELKEFKKSFNENVTAFLNLSRKTSELNLSRLELAQYIVKLTDNK
jgi:hypothetical protein